MKKIALTILTAAVLASCTESNDFDATGTFEATEVTISAEANGKIVSITTQEGMAVEKGETLGIIDSTQLFLQKKQLEAQQSAILSTRPDIKKQVASLKEQIRKQETELERVESLLKDKAATEKQYDDAKAALDITRSQLEATLSTLSSQNSSIEGNASALSLQIDQIADRIEKCYIKSPIKGVVLVKYANEGEMAVQGKPLAKVADLDNIYLRAYFTSDQLAYIKLGDTVKVTADFGGDSQREYNGKITWIASESEFTPKSIQTRNSRANLVYAVKIAVKNDGYLKLGLYGQVNLK